LCIVPNNITVLRPNQVRINAVFPWRRRVNQSRGLACSIAIPIAPTQHKSYEIERLLQLSTAYPITIYVQCYCRLSLYRIIVSSSLPFLVARGVVSLLEHQRKALLVVANVCYFGNQLTKHVSSGGSVFLLVELKGLGQLHDAHRMLVVVAPELPNDGVARDESEAVSFVDLLAVQVQQRSAVSSRGCCWGAG